MIQKTNAPAATEATKEIQLADASIAAQKISNTPDLSEAHRLFKSGFALCKLQPNTKRPEGDNWNHRPVQQFDHEATGYGVMLATNGLCSVDPDNAELSAKMLAGFGFDLDDLLNAGVRSISTRAGSGGRSAFKADLGLRKVVFSFKDVGTVLELRAHSANLQDAIPGLIYADKHGEICTQRYASDLRLDEAPDLPADFLAWWLRMSTDLEFKRGQQQRAGEILGIKAFKAVSGSDGKTLAFKSALREGFNALNNVLEILGRHDYVGDGVRFAPPTATGLPGVREIPDKDGLWQSDHASDPLCGTFDAWTAYVVLDHNGDQAAAEAAWMPVVHKAVENDFSFIEDISDLLGAPLAAERPKFEVIPAAEFAAGTPPSWIVKGVLSLAEIAVIYGESASGKSFFALDLVAAVARGIEWRGCRVRQGAVVYVAAEGAGGFRKRLAAYALAHEIDLAALPLGVVASAPNLLTDDDKALAQAIELAGGASIVVVDTLAQSTPGANENAGEDMSKVLARCKRLHAATGALVVLIHHSGKDATKGARGWSGIRAAVDAEIEITRLADARAARITKQKDGEDGAVFAFGLLPVRVGEDEDGEAIVSCVVEYQNEAPPPAREPKGAWEKAVLQMVHELAGLGDEPLTVGAIIDNVVRTMPHDPAGGRDRRRECAKRAIESLSKSAFFHVLDDKVTMPHATQAPHVAA
ncbi:MAG: AAA family ATPase [Thiobacillus sp.]